MKKAPRVFLAALVLGAFFSISATSYSFSDTDKTPAAAHPKASTGVLIAVAAAGSRLVAAGRHGIVMYSDDQGRSWTQASVPVSSTLVALSFPSTTEGWAVGHDGMVLSTSDGGRTWVERLNGRTAAALIEAYYRAEATRSPADSALAEASRQAQRLVEEGPDKPFLDVWFSDTLNGYVVGAFGLILRTRDGGKTWQPLMHLADNPMGFHYNSIRGASGNVYIGGEQGLFLKFDQKKNRFKTLSLSYAGTFTGVVVRDSTVVAFGLRGNVLRSRDEGITWEPLQASISNTIHSAAFLADGRLVLVSEGSDLLVGNDHDKSFTHATCGMPCYGIVAAGQGHVVVAGAQGVRTIEIAHEHSQKLSAR